jgi:GH35 family endo-1,4-beta-xylanase
MKVLNLPMRHLFASLFMVTAGLLFITVARADDNAISVLPAGGVSQFKLNAPTPKGHLEVVPVENQTFNRAIRATTLVKPDKAYNLQMLCPISTTIKQGDVLYATFWMRSLQSEDETGDGVSLLLFEKVGPQWNRSIQLPLTANRDWRQFRVAFICSDDYAPGQAQLIFRLGYKPQVVEFADIKLLNYRNTKTVEELPGTKITYHGREPDAPWREIAAKRIDQHRKSDLQLLINDAQGNPLANTPVTLNVKRLAFDLGTAVKARDLAGDNENSLKMQAKIKELFNCIVFENDLKWKAYKPENKPLIDKALAWCQANDMPVRGHTMVWPSWRTNPKSLKAQYESDPQGLSQAIAKRIDTIGSTFAGQLYEWDVINEPNNHHDFIDMLGVDAMSQWFKLARQADPHAVLYLNETGVPVSSPGSAVYDKLYEYIQRLQTNGAPIGGIGMQGHVGWTMNSPQQLWQIFDRFADLGLPIKITEFDIGVTDEQLAADYYRDFYTACFAHPAVNGILIWGIWEKDKSYKPEAAIFNKDWSPKPAAVALENLLRQWHQPIQTTTDRQGKINVRAFHGQYDIAVQTSTGEIHQAVTHTSKSPVSTIDLP